LLLKAIVDNSGLLQGMVFAFTWDFEIPIWYSSVFPCWLLLQGDTF
jgi:hypothetical protein